MMLQKPSVSSCNTVVKIAARFLRKAAFFFFSNIYVKFFFLIFISAIGLNDCS